jgi:predicted Zn-dependent peptidase
MTARVTTLANGLKVVTDTMPQVETVTLGVWVNVGARFERPEINGISHLLEHMAFKGTRRRNARAIAEDMEAVGGQLNAYTSRETTAYYAKVLKEDLPLVVDIISDILQHSIMDAEELARERTVIIQEINQANDIPDDVVFDRFQEIAYPGQAMGRPILGTVERVREMPRETVLGYMRDHYSATRMILSAAGNLDHDRLVVMAEEAFAALPPEKAATREPARYVGGEHRETRDLEQVNLVLGVDGISFDDDGYYPAAVFSTLFGGGMSSRLFQEVREQRGLVYSIYSFLSHYSDGGLFGIFAGTGEDEVKELMPVICDEFAKVCDAVTEEEVVRARAQLKASTVMSQESTSSRCEQLARQLMVYGRPIELAEVTEKIEAVDVPSVVDIARRIRAGKPTLAALGPLSKLEDFEKISARLN